MVLFIGLTRKVDNCYICEVDLKRFCRVEQDAAEKRRFRNEESCRELEQWEGQGLLNGSNEYDSNGILDQD